MKYSIFLDETEPGLELHYMIESNTKNIDTNLHKKHKQYDYSKSMEKDKQIKIIKEMNINSLLKWIYLRQV